MRKVLLVIVLLVIVVPIVVVVARSARPVLELTTEVKTIGQATPVSVHVTDPRGIRSASAWMVQNGQTFQVWQLQEPLKAKEATWNFVAGVRTTALLKDGPAKLIVEAQSNDLLRKSAKLERDVTVVTRPPSVSVDSEQHYIYIGMADLATFDVSGAYTSAGVKKKKQTTKRKTDKTDCGSAVE